MKSLAHVDPEIYRVIELEKKRQTNKLELIASENFVSPAVLEALGSILTHKYAEGYPGRRYYGGCEHVDTAETLAIERVKALFGAEYANVQPHSGTQANMAVYFSLLKPGDTIMGMDLAHGGHLSHGSSKSFSGQMYQVVSYGVKAGSGEIDFETVAKKLAEHRPKILVVGASAYPRILNFERFGALAQQYGAYLLVDMAHIAGLIAMGLHPSPVGVADFVTSTTHKTLRGPRGGLILAKEKFAKVLDNQIFPGIQGGPLMNTIAAKAVAFHEAARPTFKSYQVQVLANAKTLEKEFLRLGYSLVTGGTDNHLLLMDLTHTELTGRDAETALDKAGITVNKNAIPFDPRPPLVTSGIRIGTPAMTTRGMKDADMRVIANFIHQALTAHKDDAQLDKLRQEVFDFCHNFPLYAPEWET